jgi:hypothetical protein
MLVYLPTSGGFVTRISSRVPAANEVSRTGSRTGPPADLLVVLLNDGHLAPRHATVMRAPLGDVTETSVSLVLAPMTSPLTRTLGVGRIKAARADRGRTTAVNAVCRVVEVPPATAVTQTVSRDPVSCGLTA